MQRLMIKQKKDIQSNIEVTVKNKFLINKNNNYFSLR